MIRAKNIECLFRNIERREAGKLKGDDGREVSWDSGYKLEIDVIDREDNSVTTCELKLSDNEQNKVYFEKMQNLAVLSPFKADLHIMVNKKGMVKFNLDYIYLDSLEPKQQEKDIKK